MGKDKIKITVKQAEVKDRTTQFFQDVISDKWKAEDKDWEEKREKKYKKSIELMKDEVDDWDNIQHTRCQSMWMDNQRLFNEIMSEHRNMEKQWKKISIRVAKEIYKKVVTKDLVHWEIMGGKEDEVKGEVIKAKTRKLKTYFDGTGGSSDEEIDRLSTSIALEIDREIFTDLRLNAGTATTCDWKSEHPKNGTPGERIYIAMMVLSGVIYRKTLASSNQWWVVTSPRILEELKTACHSTEEYDLKDNIEHVGNLWNKYEAYCDPLFPENQILMGVKSRSCYSYCPYVLSSRLGEPISEFRNDRMFWRYSKKLPAQGAQVCGRITLKNFWEDNG